MLGLAASHLSCAGSADYGQQALAHRLSAISGLNAAMSRPNPSMADGEALFATTMALTFQSSLMHDGMLEFLAMMRGCQIVATAVMPDFTQSVFRSFARDVHIENAQMRLGKFGAPPVIDDALVEGFLLSLRALAPLCQSTLELNYLAAIERVVRLPKTDPAQGAYPVLLANLALANHIAPGQPLPSSRLSTQSPMTSATRTLWPSQLPTTGLLSYCSSISS